MSVCVLQNLEKYRVLWTDCLAPCREINRFSVSKIGPEPAKPTISLALPGRPKMTWKQLTERDRREWKLSAIDPHDRDTWRSGVRSAMRAASQLPGRGPTVVNMAPIPAR